MRDALAHQHISRMELVSVSADRTIGMLTENNRSYLWCLITVHHSVPAIDLSSVVMELQQPCQYQIMNLHVTLQKAGHLPMLLLEPC